MTTTEQIRKVCEYASGEHSTKVLCAMVNALPRGKTLETNRSVEGIFEVLDILSYLDRNKDNSLVPEPAPLYRPVISVLRDFNAGKNKAKCRKELQARLLYMTALDKKRVVYTFLENSKTDRIWTFNHLYKNWDPRFMKAIESLFEVHHEPEAAKLICRYDTVEYIRENLVELSVAYSYLEARRRLPADEPIDRELIKGNWEYLMLLAYLGLPITKKEAKSELGHHIYYEICYTSVSFQYYDSVLELPHIHQMVWALGRLKMIEVLFDLLDYDRKSQPLFKAREYSEAIELLLLMWK